MFESYRNCQLSFYFVKIGIWNRKVYKYGNNPNGRWTPPSLVYLLFISFYCYFCYKLYQYYLNKEIFQSSAVRPAQSLLEPAGLSMAFDFNIKGTNGRQKTYGIFHVHCIFYSGFMCQTTVILGITKDGSLVLNTLTL